MGKLFTIATATGNTAIANALETGLTADALFGTLLPYMGVVVTLILVSLGLYFLRRVNKGAQKGKAKF